MTITINGSGTITGATTMASAVSMSGNVTLGGAAVKVLNNSGNPVVPQTGSVLKVQQFYDAGTSTTSTTPVSIQSARFSYTPASASSTLFFIHSTDALYGTGGGFAAGSCYAYWYLAEYVSVDTAISPAAYLYNNQYSTTYQEVIRAQCTLQYSVANTATTTRIFNTTAATSNASVATNLGNIRLTIIEVAA